KLKDANDNIPKNSSSLLIGKHMRKIIIPLMAKLRKSVDETQLYVATDFWPYPNYTDLIYKI
ncbi:MAG: hypothetical protein J6V36_02900, partial [Clostridia bacterium]|nr:hypothetical protein [Clostridia bacterium]